VNASHAAQELLEHPLEALDLSNPSVVQREFIVDWMARVTMIQRLEPATWFNAVSIFDRWDKFIYLIDLLTRCRVLALKPIPLPNLQLVASVSLLIASKVQGEIPSVQCCKEVCHHCARLSLGLIPHQHIDHHYLSIRALSQHCKYRYSPMVWLLSRLACFLTACRPSDGLSARSTFFSISR
jgi:hypothetical protein